MTGSYDTRLELVKNIFQDFIGSPKFRLSKWTGRLYRGGSPEPIKAAILPDPRGDALRVLSPRQAGERAAGGRYAPVTGEISQGHSPGGSPGGISGPGCARGTVPPGPGPGRPGTSLDNYIGFTHIETARIVEIRTQVWKKLAPLFRAQDRVYKSLKAANLHHEAKKIYNCSTNYVYIRCNTCGKHYTRRIQLCRSRLCPICAKIRGITARVKINEILKKIREPKLITLTLENPKNLERDHIKKLIRYFAQLRRRHIWTARGGVYTIEIIPSETNKGTHNIHLHCLIDGGYMPQAALSRAWQEISGSKIVDIRRTTDKKVSFEISKYITKIFSREYMDNTRMLFEFVMATNGVRLMGDFGTFNSRHGRYILKDIKVIEAEEKFNRKERAAANDTCRCPDCEGRDLDIVYVDRHKPPG